MFKKYRFKMMTLVLTLCFTNTLFARNLRGRLGVGMSNQPINGIPAISIKLQKSRSFAMGALIALELDDTNGGHAAGIKVYRNLFEEPQLHFYSAVMIALVGDKQNGIEHSGFQADLTLGSEFNFQGLESLGLSFEFGISVNSVYDETIVSTAGYHMVTAGIHFYL